MQAITATGARDLYVASKQPAVMKPYAYIFSSIEQTARNGYLSTKVMVDTAYIKATVSMLRRKGFRVKQWKMPSFVGEPYYTVNIKW